MNLCIIMAYFLHALILSCFSLSYIHAASGTDLPELGLLLPNELSEEEAEYTDRHIFLGNCTSFILDPDEYEMFPNRTVFVAAYNRSYNESLYFLNEDGSVALCAPEEINNEINNSELSEIASKEFEFLSIFGVAVSVLFTFIHLVVFAVVKDLRNLPGYNLASLCLSLLMSYIFMALQSSELAEENAAACISASVLTQFFFLGDHLWMLVMASDVFRSILHATGSLRVSSKSFKMKKFLYSSCFAWGIAAVFTSAAIIADNIDGVPYEYKPNFETRCWFQTKQSLLVFFAGPIIVIICVNFILFSVSAYNIFSNRMKANDDSQRTHLRKSHLMYFRLSVIMGVTWITGALAPLLHQVWLWYLFAALNTLQGLFIFIAFSCAKKVRNFFRKKFLGGRRASEQTLNPTFQSYCFYANSIEKDLDKIIEIKDKNDATDTIMIHL